jgi:hypothetical protein
MSHTDVIIITVTLFTISTVGIFAGLRYINLHTRPPVNTLLRSRGDIELQYIEPSTNNTLDLLQPEQVYTSERVLNFERLPQDYTSERITNSSEVITSSLRTNPPSYHTFDLLQPEQVYINERIDSSNTNSYLDDSINLQRIPSYFNDLYINCCLEDSINLNYIYFIIYCNVNNHNK